MDRQAFDLEVQRLRHELVAQSAAVERALLSCKFDRPRSDDDLDAVSQEGLALIGEVQQLLEEKQRLRQQMADGERARQQLTRQVDALQQENQELRDAAVRLRLHHAAYASLVRLLRMELAAAQQARPADADG